MWDLWRNNNPAGHRPGFVGYLIEPFGLIGETNRFVTLTAGNDAVIESDVRGSTT
jgi:hypothetical protein